MKQLLITLLCALLAAAPARADSRITPTSREQINLSFGPLVKRVAPAVVNIYTRTVIEQKASPFFNDPFFNRFFGSQGFTRRRMENALGSGVIVRPDGLIVTNHHVIDGADEITVLLNDRREFDATVVLSDPRADLAVLRIDTRGADLPWLDLADSDALEVGDLVLAIGNPFGVGQTVTMGIVSATARSNAGISDINSFIQTDAAINPGNSGGALIGVDGKLAGVNTAIFSRSGGSLGIGFAVPANMIQSVIHAAETGGQLRRPWLGASGQAVDHDSAESLGLDRPAGVLVSKVHEGAAADRAGVKVGDIILAVNGKAVDDPESLRFRVAILEPGAKADLSVRRKGKTLTLTLTAEPAPDLPPRDESRIEGASPFAGATVANLNPALAEELGLEADAGGVIITAVDGRSSAAGFGFAKGDMIQAVNGAPVEKVADLKTLANARSRGWDIQLQRNGRTIRTQFWR